MFKNGIVFICCLVCLTGCMTNQREKMLQHIAEARKSFNDNIVHVNDSISEVYLTALLEFTGKYPKDSLVPEYFFDAATVYRFKHQPQPALDIYKRIYQEYPKYPKNADCLFLQGMVLSNEMNQREEGIKIFKEFIVKYPNHFLVPQINQLIEQLSMTDEELIESFKKDDRESTRNK